jgi:hypothetical protein
MTITPGPWAGIRRPRGGYAALWLGALLATNGTVRDPFPLEIEELAWRYFEAYPPYAMA